MTHITIEREALQTVLDTLEENHHLIEQYERLEYLALYDRQITVIKKALAAPVQEPVAQDAEQWGLRLSDASWAATKAWNPDLMGPMTGKIFNNIKGLIRTAIISYLKGYTVEPAAQPAVPLTPEQIIDIRRKTTAKTHGEWADTKTFARAIEAAHGITEKDQP